MLIESKWQNKKAVLTENKTYTSEKLCKKDGLGGVLKLGSYKY